MFLGLFSGVLLGFVLWVFQNYLGMYKNGLCSSHLSPVVTLTSLLGITFKLIFRFYSRFKYKLMHHTINHLYGFLQMSSGRRINKN